ncbi:histidine kinase [Ruminococcaceae bacterium OttesenSCG-928-L11]|nr:histidine kinase [Ruminococcaceae bacterium OttesenSCG-928-L11]
MEENGRPRFIPSLKQRLSVILIVCSLLSVIMMIAVSYLAMQAAESTRVEDMLAGDLLQLSEQMDSEYTELLQISQQMIPQSAIGGYLQAYMQAVDQYDRIELMKKITTDITTMRFNHDSSSLTLCFEPEPETGAIRTGFYTNLAVRPDFRLDNHPVVRSTGIAGVDALEFYVLHPSDCVIYARESISLSRRAAFGDNREVVLYLELFSRIPERLETLSELRGMPYYWLQTDPEGVIRYSSHRDFSTGTWLGESTGAGAATLEDFLHIQADSIFGFQYVLMVPRVNFNRAMAIWRNGVIAVLATAVIFISITAAMLLYLIFRPMHILRGEIEQVTKGDFSLSRHNIRLQEFDQLFDSMNDMKMQIQELLVQERRQEKEKMQLELDKLYYQINPHFLMNALNTVHWMAVTNHQPEIKEFIHQLNFILGYSLGKTNCNATLQTELLALKAYVSLQLCRYDFEIHYDIAEGIYLQVPCARLILQPIAENAICHNMEHLGNLWVTVRQEGDFAVICVRDDGQGFAAGEGTLAGERGLSRGIGLRYVELSLQSFYAQRADMQIESAQGRGTAVTLRVPLKESGGDRDV